MSVYTYLVLGSYVIRMRETMLTALGDKFETSQTKGMISGKDVTVT